MSSDRCTVCSVKKNKTTNFHLTDFSAEEMTSVIEPQPGGALLISNIQTFYLNHHDPQNGNLIVTRLQVSRGLTTAEH